MPPRRRPAAAESLTEENLAVLAAAVAEGRRATVYLREGTPSLGLPAGSSARVISVDGSTVLVRPRGVDDELPYEADELRMTKSTPPQPNPPQPNLPQPKSAQPDPPEKKRALRPSATGPKAAPAPTPSGGSASGPDPDPKPAAKPSPAPAATPSTTPRPRAAAPSGGRSTKTSAARGASKSVTVTIFGSAENQWSVAVTRGARKPQRSRTVSPEAVDAAMGALGDAAAAEAVTTLLHAAREEAQRRVEELSRELAAAREALAALDGAGT